MRLLIQGYEFHIVNLDEGPGRLKVRVPAPHHAGVKVLEDAFFESGDGPLEPWTAEVVPVAIHQESTSPVKLTVDGEPIQGFTVREFPQPRLVRMNLEYVQPFSRGSCEALLEIMFEEGGDG